MKRTSLSFALRLAGTFVLCLLGPASVRGQSTAFTYQGSLQDGGTPASGLHDFRFRLFDAASGGAQIGSTLCLDNVGVLEGVFTAQLDFGQQFATTAPRHLEIEVRRDIGQSCANAAGFVVLAPRQQITAAPLAAHANSAFSLDAADGAPSNAVFVDNGGNVGVGTTSPAARLHLKGSDECLRIDGANPGSSNVCYLTFRDANGGRIGYVGDGSGNDNSVYVNSDAGDVHLYTAVGAVLTAKSDGKLGVGTTIPRSTLHVHGQSAWLTGGNGGGLPAAAGAGLRLYHDGSRGMIFSFDYASASPRDLSLQEPGGNVGIGTSTPSAKLDVRGDIRLGSSGQYQATAGSEALRLLRGEVDGNGTRLVGTGFTAQRSGEGVYDLTFVPAFSGPPTIIPHVIQASTDPRSIQVVSVTAGSARLVTEFIHNFLNTDSDWSFCAVGPR